MKQWFAFVVFIAALITGSVSVSAQEAPMQLAVDAQVLKIQTAAGEKNFALEIADTDQSRSAGLMYRTDFPADRAMIFVFGEERPVMMWMANTPLPLDMLFVHKDGTIAHIAENTKPFSKDIVSSGVPVAFVIEVNAGIAEQEGIKAGDKVRHRIICRQCK
ncbi:DUF192 domain-containing protein [Bacillus subtilis]|uniref:DUF192 domain-containing protein n=1 Tax=Pseudochrobactrum asaccharolyticum TaxID=354351 RepID=UPI001F255413|nr:DUF192 domain-containing protein [Pseudochrobactrum asaccharolyticum]MCF7647332.1 DUF192 domain-containing protein [Pseudochrobactrum asaccharolyticum]MCF7672572.1 DUF192 domain-containing protein [Bacillus subtilis]